MIESLQHEPLTLPVRPFGRVARSVAGYAVATALMLITPLLVFVPASLFHCAMRNGRRAAWATALAATFLAGLWMYLAELANPSAGVQMKLTIASFLAMALTIALPSALAVPLVDRRAKFGTVVTIALVCGAIGLVMTELIMRVASFSPYAVQMSEMAKMAATVVDATNRAGSATAITHAQLWLVTHISMVIPAVLLFNIAVVFVLSLMMYGRLSVWRTFAATRVADNDTRRAYLFRGLSFPDSLLFVFVIGGLTPVVAGVPQQIAANCLTIAVFLFMLQGLAIFRFMMVKAGAGYIGGLFGFFLLAMLCVTGIGLLLLALVGLFDPFFDFRHLKRKDDSHESHTD